MDFKNNKKDKLSIDFEMDHLKDHLNASFDKDNLIMSEELIHKTLSAIEKGESPKTSIEEDKKKIKYPVFKIAGTAAAILILIVGIAYSQGYLSLSGQNKSIEKLKSIPDLKMAAKQDSNDASYSLKAAPSTEVQDNKAAGSARINNDTATNKEIASDNKASTETTAGESMGILSKASDDVPQEPILITDLLPAADQIKEVTITNENQQEVKIQNNPEEVLKLYDLLGSVTLTTGEILSNTIQYKITINTIDNQTYTTSISDGIEVINENQKSTQTEYYKTNDTDALVMRLHEYVNQLK
jgi:hypothetical protein